ncbi:hypothetical protein COOONC_09123 [Cooperia oncophora]
MGLVDSVVQPLGDGLLPAAENTHKYLERIAVDTARQIADGTLKVTREKPLVQKLMNKALTNSFVLDKVVLKMARDKVNLKNLFSGNEQTAGNYPAPLRILETVRKGLVEGPVEGYNYEAQCFGELTQSYQAKALIGLFNGSTECKKNKFGEGRPVK